MKKRVHLLFIFLFFVSVSYAQIPDDGYRMAKKILNLIAQNKPAELAKLVNYPLSRPNPIPDIKNQAEFIAYYPNLFDAKFKKMIVPIKQDHLMERNGIYGFVGDPFAGEIWFDDRGIVSINYSSDKEQSLQKTLDKMVKATIHPSVNQWESNVFVAKSKNLLVRVDEMPNGDLRYSSWSKGKPINQKPDLVLYNGTKEILGSMGNITWTFSNENWLYIFNNYLECESCKKNEVELILQESGIQKSRIVMTISK